ncbi:uncharacterized protein LOC130894792 [Diorhabda carinulata]|uniref:uncharacterized protein LOC130894792 n=1 Tax=Diorhabda carinulata TaxID=1163345 RepID=UPI0025A03EC3|nr:uncharacterized protein LOC130894792 [Diorhabda carinulata]
MENKSDFIPAACSTVSKKKVQRNTHSSIFDEDNSIFPMSTSQLQEKNLSDVSYELEAQKKLARTSLQRANKVSALPSKYLRANYSKSESTSHVHMYNESTVSESDLLNTPKSASTPRNSIQSLEQLSYRLKNSDLSIDNWVDDFKKVIKNTGDQTSNMFKPAEELSSMLLADEMSWRQKNEIPIKDEQFSVIQAIENESVGNFFQQRCDTLSEFPGGASPNTTREPVPLIESMSAVNITEDQSPSDEGSPENQKKISVSMIQRFLAESSCTPKSAVNNIYKLCEDNQRFVSLENKPIYSLPVSKNSSYTSDHSENSAMKQICNKENIDSLNTKTSSSNLCPSQTSSRASSAMSSLQNGKLPIETTKCELIWGCVKLGKSVTQEFIIRNRSAKKLGIQLSLTSQEFKIRKDNRNDSEPLSSNKILLHAHESKAIIISFVPTKRGAAVDDLIFTSLDPNMTQTRKQSVRLFGYGGFFKVDFYNLTRDTAGKFWMSLGKLDDRTLITSTFKVKNKGDLPVFIYISIQSLDTCKLCVNPNLFVLLPQMQKEIAISYRPSSEDYNFKLDNSPVVSDLGNLIVTFGAEVDRGRLRRICEKSIESGLKIDSIANVLKEKIEGEVMPIDLIMFKESPANMKEILKLLNYHQIVLTLERDPEQTIIQQYSDDSGLYQSLYQDTTIVAAKSNVSSSCYVSPLMILLTLPYKYKDTVFLKSESNCRLNFKISCQNHLDVKPKEGTVEPHGTAILTIKYCSNTVSEKKCLKVIIVIEKEIFEVEVRVDSLGQIKNKNKSILNCI